MRSWRVLGRAATAEWLAAEQVRLGRWNRREGRRFLRHRNQLFRRYAMGKGILLWLLGIPIPIIILLLLFWH
jgi:hypothetical protein